MTKPFAMRLIEASAEEKAEATKNLRALMPMLVIAANMAQLTVPDGQVKICVADYSQEGTGQIIASFDARAFIDDLGKLLGVDPLITSRPS